MVDKSKKMEVESICLPIELDQVLDGFAVENFDLVAFTHATKNIDVVVGNTSFPSSGVGVQFLVIICSDLWKKVEAILDLEHLS